MQDKTNLNDNNIPLYNNKQRANAQAQAALAQEKIKDKKRVEKIIEVKFFKRTIQRKVWVYE